MLRAADGIPDRIHQTASIVFGSGRKGERLMADAIGIPPAALDSYAHHAWTPEQEDQLNLFLGALVRQHAVALPVYAPQQKRELLYLAEQYEAPRHRPVVPPAPGADTGQEFIQTEPADDIPRASLDDMSHIPEPLREQWRELLADD